MQRLKSLNEIYQKRLIRPTYAHHQATPYAIGLDASLYNTDGSIRPPISTDTSPLTRSVSAYTLNGSLAPGSVVVKTTGEFVTIATGANAAEQPFGLLANWVGGDFDDIGPQNIGSGVVGAWKGPDSTYTLLAPAYNDSGLAAAVSAAASTGVQVPLYADTDGRLKYISSAGSRIQVARLIDRPSATRIVVELVI